MTFLHVRWAIASLVLATARVWATESPLPEVKDLKVTILSTMLADEGLGEWGFSALVEADGHKILYDTGAHPDVVLKNANTLKISLTDVPDVVLSHFHADHTSGLMTLRKSVVEKTPTALSRVHVGDGIFTPRRRVLPMVEANEMIARKVEYEKTGGVFVIHTKPDQIVPGVWLTGPVPRVTDEHNWNPGIRIVLPTGTVEDTLPEDSALVINTAKGLVVVTGCGHAGIVNICTSARTFARPARFYGIIGGMHLYNATEAHIQWTADRLNAFGVDNLMGAHCTGIETLYTLRRALSLDRAHAVVGAVGASFTLAHGIDPGEIAK